MYHWYAFVILKWIGKYKRLVVSCFFDFTACNQLLNAPIINLKRSESGSMHNTAIIFEFSFQCFHIHNLHHAFAATIIIWRHNNDKIVANYFQYVNTKLPLENKSSGNYNQFGVVFKNNGIQK